MHTWRVLGDASFDARVVSTKLFDDYAHVAVTMKRMGYGVPLFEKYLESKQLTPQERSLVRQALPEVTEQWLAQRTGKARLSHVEDILPVTATRSWQA